MLHNKPDFDLQQVRSFAAELKIALVSAAWNSEYNDEMKISARQALENLGLKPKNILEYQVPGAYELPVFALHLSESQEIDAIICFATIIKGDTYHFELVANDSSRGLMDVMLDTGIPILNCILACNNEEQAMVRASRKEEDKGKEVALSAIALINEIARL